ncbi:MAG: extracellular solute-binding protein [Desulfurococcaceae archaeon]
MMIIVVLTILLIVSNILTYQFSARVERITETTTMITTRTETITRTEISTTTLLTTIPTTITVPTTVSTTTTITTTMPITVTRTLTVTETKPVTVAEVIGLPSPGEIQRMFPTTVTIEILDSFAGMQEHAFEEIIRAFEDYTGGKIRIERSYTDAIISKLRLLALDGRFAEMPHIVGMIDADVVALVAAGALEPIEEFVILAGLDPSDFQADAWRASFIKDRQYYVPIDIQPFVLYFRLDFARQYNVSLPLPACHYYGLPCWRKPLETREDFIEWFMDEVSKKMPLWPATPTGIVPLGLPGGGSWEFWTVVETNVFAGDGTDWDPKPAFTSEEAKKAYWFLRKIGTVPDISLFIAWWVPMDRLDACMSNPPYAGQARGTFLWPHGTWKIALWDFYSTQPCEYGVIPWLRETRPFAMSHVLAVTKRVTMADELTKKAISIFLAFMFQPKYQGLWGVYTAHAPLHLALRYTI